MLDVVLNIRQSAKQQAATADIHGQSTRAVTIEGHTARPSLRGMALTMLQLDTILVKQRPCLTQWQTHHPRITPFDPLTKAPA